MMLKFSFGRPDAETMRDIASQAGVDWPTDDQTGNLPVQYSGRLIGYPTAPNDADETAIKDAAESITGVRPTVQ